MPNKYKFFLAIFSVALNCLAEFNIDSAIAATTINFLWINSAIPEANSVDKYVIPEPYKRQILLNDPTAVEYIYAFNRIMLWAKLNPRTKIKIWYDSTTAAPNAKQKSIEEFTKLGIHNHIEIIDINDKLKAYNILFKHELPIYYRVDIVRVLASYVSLKESLEAGHESIFAYFDLSIDPIKLDYLYKYQNTLKNLNTYGIVMGKTEQTPYENSFFLMSNNRPKVLDALLGALINKNIVRVQHKAMSPLKDQQVYDDFAGMMTLLHALEGRAKIYEKLSQDFDLSSMTLEGPQELAQVSNLKELSLDELKNYVTLKALAPGKQRLFNYNEADYDSNFIYKPGPALGGLKQIPTRACISKTSKLSN